MDHLAQSNRNCFSTSVIDRMSEVRKNKEWIQEQLAHPKASFVPVWRNKNLFSLQEIHRPVFLDWTAVSQLITADLDAYIFLGMQAEIPYFAINVPENEDNAPELFFDFGQFNDIRRVGAFIESNMGELLIYARGITYWHQSQRFCGVCGHPTESQEGGHMRVCINDICNQQIFPRTDPAIIVLVTYGKRCLLARTPGWKANGYATLAGFVEPGESLESAVVREVYEETGIHVDSVTYHSSQPWPFPCSIMLGFTAQASDPKIRIDGDEIEDARWFSPADIYNRVQAGTLILPPRISISYSLIAHWYDGNDNGRLADIVPVESKW